MRKTLLILAAAIAAASAGTAQAQIKCWTEGGKRVCGDNPPAGAKATTIRGTSPAAPAAVAPAAPAAKDAAGKGEKAAKQGPLTPAEQEQEYRKRQAESQKAAEKSAAEQRERAAKQDACEQAKAALRSYETGQRVQRTDDKGERYFLDDAQISQERSKARQTVQRSCE